MGGGVVEVSFFFAGIVGASTRTATTAATASAEPTTSVKYCELRVSVYNNGGGCEATAATAAAASVAVAVAVALLAAAAALVAVATSLVGSSMPCFFWQQLRTIDGQHPWRRERAVQFLGNPVSLDSKIRIKFIS